MALPMRRAYPRAGVHFIPKGFVVPILETLQIMKARKLCTKWTHRNLLGARHLVITFGKMMDTFPATAGLVLCWPVRV